MSVPFIDLWSFNFYVTCHQFDQSYEAFWMKSTHNVIILLSDVTSKWSMYEVIIYVTYIQTIFSCNSEIPQNSFGKFDWQFNTFCNSSQCVNRSCVIALQKVLNLSGQSQTLT